MSHEYRLGTQQFSANEKRALTDVKVVKDTDHGTTKATVVDGGLPFLGVAPGVDELAEFSALRDALGHTRPVLQAVTMDVAKNGVQFVDQEGDKWVFQGDNAVQKGVEHILLQDT